MLILLNLLAGLTYLIQPGKPSVPVIRKLIQDDTTGINVTVTYAESTAKIEIQPAHYPVLKNSDKRITFKDPSVYEKDAFYPDRPYNFYHLGKRRGVKYFILEVHPYQYNPVRRIVRYAESIDIKGIKRIKLSKQEDKDTLLVVTPPEFLSSLNYFLFYKRVCGFTVETLIIESNWDTAMIREEIKIRNPDYLLLVGDVSKIPAFHRIIYIPGDVNPHRDTDLYYACSDSDYIPDIYYGRISVENTQELSNIIKKIINYDSLNAPWINRAFFMASNDPAWHTLAEMTQIYSMEKVRQNGMEADSHFASNSNRPGTPLKEAFSDGRSIAAYSGHGGKYRWGGETSLPSLELEDIHNLPPNLRTPIIFSFACLTGSYGENDCFMEEWLLQENKGSIISFGSSTGSFWEEDDILQRRIFDVLFEDKEIGAIIDTAKLLYARDYTGDSILILSYYQQYNLFGDPTLKVRYRYSGKTFLDIPKIVTFGDTIHAYLGESGRIGLFQGSIGKIFDVERSGSVKIPLNTFDVGTVRVIAKALNKLITGKLIYISPEPISEMFKIENNLTLDEFTVNFYAIPGKVETSLYDCLGRKIKGKSWLYSTDGEKTEKWDIKDLHPGVYFIQVKQGNYWDLTGKIIKL